MAQQLSNPDNVPGGVVSGYQAQNNLINAHKTGHINIGLININTNLAPQIMNGSVFELNGGLYRCSNDETITIGSPTVNKVIYIYAVAEFDDIKKQNIANFMYSAVTPTWNPAKGGRYNGNDRAVAKFFYTGGQYNGKVILDNYNAMQMTNTEQPIPTTDGQQVITGVVNQVQSATLQAGAYRYEIKAGKGGNGGNGGDYDGNGGKGGEGAEGEVKSGTFILTNPRKIYYGLGGDGENGESGNESKNTGGGGGCTGGSAFIDLIDDFILCIGGSGGGAGAGSEDGSGGGGGGGYGTASDGENDGGGRGKGGSNGVGGDGGSITNIDGGYGGSGYIRGGASRNGYPSGGGYGEPGSSFNGTRAGASQTGENPIGPIEKYPYRIQYQGGGQGGDSHDTYNGGGYGGGGLKPTSSGYTRIYRQW
jgi:hypothetical protein